MRLLDFNLPTGPKISILESSIELVMEVNDQESIIALVGHTGQQRVYVVKGSYQSILSKLGRFN